MNQSKKLKLESQNFRVCSNGWKKKTIDNIAPLESHTQDIWEINEGKLKGEQLFTWEAAIRETRKAGKRIPTGEELSKLAPTKENMENLLLAGYRYTNGCFYNQGTSLSFWLSSESRERGLYSTDPTVERNTNDKALGFSVRCLQN